MECILRFSGAVRRDPAIDTWLRGQRDELKQIAEKWFARMRQCGAGVRELMHDGCPVACVDDVPFGYVNAFKDHVNVGFFNGAVLEDPAGLLEGTGKRMRHVKLRPGRELDFAAIGDLIEAAYLDMKTHLANPNSWSAAEAEPGATPDRGGIEASRSLRSPRRRGR